MLPDPALNPTEILPQPVVLKSNAGIGVGLRRRLIYQRLNRFDFVGDSRQYLPFSICIGESGLNGQHGAEQP